MSDFKAKTHQIRLPPQTPLREPIALPQTSKLDFRGLLLRGGKRGGEGKERGEITMGFSLPKVNFLVTSLERGNFVQL